jgi:hypothetical protein
MWSSETRAWISVDIALLSTQSSICSRARNVKVESGKQDSDYILAHRHRRAG